MTALDRLRSDPYQFYAGSILRLRELDALDAEFSPARRGEVAHMILERWHNGEGTLADLAADELRQMRAHPLVRALWRPRLLKALEWVEGELAAAPERVPVVIEEWGQIEVRGITLFGKADRIDVLPGGALAVVDYKTGKPPSRQQVAEGYALQLGTLGLMARAGAFDKVAGEPVRFEYWSLGSSKTSQTGFGHIQSAVRETERQQGLTLEEFLPQAEAYLNEALDAWILGDEPFTARLNPNAPGYATYDQLMRLDEWVGRET